MRRTWTYLILTVALWESHAAARAKFSASTSSTIGRTGTRTRTTTGTGTGTGTGTSTSTTGTRTASRSLAQTAPRRHCASAESLASSSSSSSSIWKRLRGGSTTTTAAASTSTTTADDATSMDANAAMKKDDLQAYRLQQQLYLQSRSLQIRQALITRGLTALQHGAVQETAASTVQDWDCALATAEHPKSCLYSFDAEQGSKVVAPLETDQWITLSALNRLRRTDPTKVEPLWHSQYSILKTWLHPASKYSLYRHLSVTGTALSYLLDAPTVLGVTLAAAFVALFLATLPLWTRVVQTILTHPILWKQWPSWGRFVHAALPLKLLLGQLAYKGLASVAGQVYNRVRDELIEWECQIWEDCVPLTILENGSDDGSDDALAVSDGEMQDEEDSDEEDSDEDGDW